MKKKSNGTLINRMPELRAREKLTQQDLAKRVGVSRQTIISIEKVRYTPSLTLAFEIAQALNCEITEVFQYKKEE
ncbi:MULTISPECIES: helix-turn-helix transcriptional regulator [Bacillaceae]|uniref:helix-turn-helix transcriptional regulator n=1 Tax=Bacillaceae TaxID=186817 RepID=UPI001C0E9530|nr:helix-turn-helix transcriptional regulator [Amphibacillus sp. MSJ-3]MBU5594552.1 helix-turn-helix transcriptional regulator [Amphibacillus sp. MSJ-3]